MKKFIIIYCTILYIACNFNKINENKITIKPKVDYNYTKLISKKALKYCKSNNYNNDFCILIDMSLHSGVNRFFVWDFKKDTIKYSFLVGHGCCDSEWDKDYTKENPKFSNKDESHCSSIGKYKIGERSYSDWGVNIKYSLHGLDSSNSNAFKRIIVFHSWDRMSDNEIFPKGSPEGWGCPTISNNNFKKIDSLLKKSKKPTLMWIYNHKLY